MKLTQETKSSLGISNGVQVAGLKSGPVKDAGIKDGFIILEVNGRAVNSSEDVEDAFNQVMKSNDDKVLVISGIYPTGKKYYYAVNLSSEAQ
jgi:S1-C subfamily serine protease